MEKTPVDITKNETKSGGGHRDYAKLKQEYFDSAYASVHAFFLQEHQIDTVSNKTVAGKTVGWRKEKDERTARLIQEREEELNEARSKAIGNLKAAIINTANKVAVRLNQSADEMDAKDLKILWEIAKVEVGETTSLKEVKVQGEINILEQIMNELPDLFPERTEALPQGLKNGSGDE